MTFNECVKRFPLNDTLIGSYEQDGTVTIPPNTTLRADERFRMLEWNDEYAIPFLIYNPTRQNFECWFFAFQRVKGYMTEDDIGQNFLPMTYSESLGWEPVDYLKDKDDSFITPDEELAKIMGFEDAKSFEARREQIAYMFDNEAYMNGYIITTYNGLNKFIKENLIEEE